MTAKFYNMDTPVHAAAQIANMLMEGQGSKSATVRLAETFEGSGGAYGEPVYLRTTDLTPSWVTPETFRIAVEDGCAGMMTSA